MTAVSTSGTCFQTSEVVQVAALARAGALGRNAEEEIDPFVKMGGDVVALEPFVVQITYSIGVDAHFGSSISATSNPMRFSKIPAG
jgi:hypothetical protein